MDASPRVSVVFFSSNKLPTIVTVTTLVLFDHLLCGTLLCIYLSEGPVQLSDESDQHAGLGEAVISSSGGMFLHILAVKHGAAGHRNFKFASSSCNFGKLFAHPLDFRQPFPPIIM